LISKSADSGRVARSAYTYLHMPIVAGIVLAAVADALALKGPTGHADLKTALSAIGGPLLFLVGTILFKRDIRGWLQLSHGAGIFTLAVLGIFARDLSALTLSALTTAIMVIVAAWESISLRGGGQSPQVTAPSQQERRR
jgi:low temperature requirement protein LtrA